MLPFPLNISFFMILSESSDFNRIPGRGNRIGVPIISALGREGRGGAEVGSRNRLPVRGGHLTPSGYQTTSTLPSAEWERRGEGV